MRLLVVDHRQHEDLSEEIAHVGRLLTGEIDEQIELGWEVNSFGHLQLKSLEPFAHGRVRGVVGVRVFGGVLSLLSRYIARAQNGLIHRSSDTCWQGACHSPLATLSQISTIARCSGTFSRNDLRHSASLILSARTINS